MVVTNSQSSFNNYLNAGYYIIPSLFISLFEAYMSAREASMPNVAIKASANEATISAKEATMGNIAIKASTREATMSAREATMENIAMKALAKEAAMAFEEATMRNVAMRSFFHLANQTSKTVEMEAFKICIAIEKINPAMHPIVTFMQAIPQYVKNVNPK